MIKKSSELEYYICSEEELSAADREVLQAARSAVQLSYAPYSNFHVGAAVLLDDGRIMQGSNQENESFPAGLCAERTLLGYVGANGNGYKINIMAISAESEGLTREVTPCGICRQTIVDMTRRQASAIRLLLDAPNHIIVIEDAARLLPLSFNLEK
ncbi:MAG: cytidine deaminase [Rikenellaceae bacterium]|nr:cytidine deaminase [Rikenellaceae bacterium]